MEYPQAATAFEEAVSRHGAFPRKEVERWVYNDQGLRCVAYQLVISEPQLLGSAARKVIYTYQFVS